VFLLGKIIEQQRQDRFQRWHCERERRRRREQDKCILSQRRMLHLASSNNVTPEAERVVVACIERDPGDPGKRVPGPEPSDPLGSERRFAEACRCLKQRELVREVCLQEVEEPYTFDLWSG
jgi:hypothetical protein